MSKRKTLPATETELPTTPIKKPLGEQRVGDELGNSEGHGGPTLFDFFPAFESILHGAFSRSK